MIRKVFSLGVAMISVVALASCSSPSASSSAPEFDYSTLHNEPAINKVCALYQYSYDHKAEYGLASLYGKTYSSTSVEGPYANKTAGIDLEALGLANFLRQGDSQIASKPAPKSSEGLALMDLWSTAFDQYLAQKNSSDMVDGQVAYQTQQALHQVAKQCRLIFPEAVFD